MRTTTTKQVTSTHETITVTCDLCGKKGRVSCDNVEWDGKDDYAIEETTIQLKTGVGYPEGGHSNYTNFDVCGDCFTSKVFPALVGLGIKPQKSRSDW